MPLHWAAEYIGKPWVSGAQGPDAFNCGGLVRYIYRERKGIILPEVIVDDNSLLQVRREFKRGIIYRDWRQVDVPMELDGVELSHAEHPHHVGLWVDADGGKVLHCITGAGVVAMDRLHLKLAGWNILGFWRHAQCQAP